jgi:hypothetical protein
VEATQADDGWTIAESEAMSAKLHGDNNYNERINPNQNMPRQVQLSITSAPAEFCLPMKSDRQFKPHFQVQVGWPTTDAASRDTQMHACPWCLSLHDPNTAYTTTYSSVRVT